MRIVNIVKRCKKDDVILSEGKSYVMAEDIEFYLRNLHKGCLGSSQLIDPIYKKYEGQDLTGKKLMCWRTGGIGDMLFLVPVLRYLKKKYKGCHLTVCSGCKQPLENLPEIDELYDMPFDAKILEGKDYHLMFQGILEKGSEVSRRKHAVDLFFDYFGIDSTHLPREDKMPKISFTTKEMGWLEKKLEKLEIKKSDYVVGVQMESSSPLRNFPRDKMKVVVDTLAQEPDIKVLMIGSKDHSGVAGFYKGKWENVLNATNNTVRESIVLANRYNLILSPDSFIIQIAGSLGKPVVGLYGPFPSELRMKYFDNAIGLDPKTPCSPCCLHDSEPCIKGHPSPCFSLTSPQDILQALDFLKRKFTGQHFKYLDVLLEKPDLEKAEEYMMSIEKGLCIFGGYYKHPNTVSVDTNDFVNSDISDLTKGFRGGSMPFVLYMDNFSQDVIQVYEGSKRVIKPGGYFIVYKAKADIPLYNHIKKDVGSSFLLQYTEYDEVKKTFLIIGQKRY